VEGVAYRRDILAGSRPGRRGTLVSAKVPKAICACAIARNASGCPARLIVSGGPPKGHPCPCGGRAPCCASLSLLLLASPGLAIRGEPVQRGRGPLDLCRDPLHPFRARSGPTSPPSALGSAKGAGKKYQYKHRPFGCTFWLRWVLGLSKGVSKQNKYTRLPAAGVGPGERRQKTLSPKSSAHSPYLASPLADHGLRFTPHNSRFCVGRFFLRIVSALAAVNS